jgi:drug/metabolite transporter (DMT)-like permease
MQMMLINCIDWVNIAWGYLVLLLLCLPLLPMKNQTRSYLFALASVLFWSTMSSAFKLSLNYITVEGLLFWSVVFAVFSLGLSMLLLKKHHHLSQLKKEDIARSALMGLITPFLYYLVLFKAYELLQAQEAGVLNYAWPVILVVLSVPFLGQRIGFFGFAGIFISFAGLIVISTKGDILSLNFTNPLGVLLALGSAFLWATYWIINMKDKRESISKLFLNMLFACIYITIYSLATNSFVWPQPQAWLGAAYIGFFEMGITFIFWLTALKFAENTAKVSNLIFLSPFMGLFFIRIFVKEVILVSTIIGLALIISGILLQQIKLNRQKGVT